MNEHWSDHIALALGAGEGQAGARLPAFFPALLEDPGAQLGTPIIPSRQWCEGWKRRFYGRVAADLPRRKGERVVLSELNRRLERLVTERLLL